MRAAFLLVLAACGEGAASSGDDAGSNGTDAIAPVVRPDARRLPDAARDRRDSDGNASPADAVALVIGGAPVEGSSADYADFDYFSVEAVEGQYVALVLELTGHVPSSPPAATLLSPHLEWLVTSSGDVHGCAGIPTASLELVTRIPASGVHIVEIVPRWSVEGWRIRAIDLATVPSTLVVGESGAPRLTREHRCVLGAFEAAGDVDSVALDLDLYAGVGTRTPERHGSTGSARLLEITDTEGNVRSRGDREVVVDTAAPLTLRVVGPAVRGANDHYQLLSTGAVAGRLRGPLFHVEEADAANDDRARAEVLAPPPLDERGPPTFVFRIPPGDVDHFAIDASDRATLELSCQAEWIGSGVRGLAVRLLAPDGSVAQTARENELGVAQLSGAIEAGRTVVRVTSESREASIASNLAACALWVASR